MDKNKKRKRKNKRYLKMNIYHLKQLNINAAGIDFGSGFHYVAVPIGRDAEGQDVRHFIYLYS